MASFNLKLIQKYRSRLIISLLLLFLLSFWQLKLPFWLTNWLVFPSLWAEKEIDVWRRYFINQDYLLLENEKLRSSYGQLLDRCSVVKNSKLKPLPQNLKKEYDLFKAKIIMIRGGDIIVESQKKIPPGSTGLVILNTWLIGDWANQDGGHQTLVNLWLYPRFPLKVKITDKQGLFITAGILEIKSGRLAVSHILRGVNIKSGQVVHLLSGQYQDLPPIGLIKNLVKQDAVYQVWNLNTWWQKEIKIDNNVWLIKSKI